MWLLPLGLRIRVTSAGHSCGGPACPPSNTGEDLLFSPLTEKGNISEVARNDQKGHLSMVILFK
jgi:hypothetical protein